MNIVKIYRHLNRSFTIHNGTLLILSAIYTGTYLFTELNTLDRVYLNNLIRNNIFDRYEMVRLITDPYCSFRNALVVVKN